MDVNQLTDNHLEVFHFIKDALDHLKNNQTKTIRNLSKQAFFKLDDQNIDDVLMLCEKLLKKRQWAYGVIAYDFAYRVKHQYTLETFDIFEKWLFEYVTGWGDCDDFCTHAFGALLSQYHILFERIKKWTQHPKFIVRRASAVVLVYPIKYHHDQEIDPFVISDLLIHDQADLVQKGYGWMLKVLSQKQPLKVYAYLKMHHQDMPRTAYRYALEKLDTSIKKELMSL